MAKKLTCDLLVVGAGPAGSRAAMRAASNGLEVILIDSKPRIGERPHCGEFVPYQVFTEFGLDRNSILHKIDHLDTWILKDKAQVSYDKNSIRSNGYLIDRPKFDRNLAREAASCGALVMSSSTFVDFASYNCVIKSVGEKVTVDAQYIIAADGARSSVRNKMGLLVEDCAVGRQIETPLATSSSRAMVFLDQELYGGYGWLFPKGTTANIGIGLLPTNELTAARGLKSLSEMLSRIGMIKPGWFARTSGFIPGFGIRFPLVVENILFCGDAAGLAHPITGAGIAQAVFSGDIAGEIVTKAVKSGVSSVLEEYHNAILYRYGAVFRHALAKKKLQLYSWWNNDFPGLCKRTWISFKGYRKREPNV